jgi:spoIIIJ-associated protein
MKPNRDGQQGMKYRGGRRNDGPNRGNGPRREGPPPRRDGNRDSGRDGNRSFGNRPGGYRDGNRDGNRDFHRSNDRDRGGEHREPREGRGWVEVTGRNVDEAREEAVRRFNTQADQMRIEVLEEGSRGFLGIGTKPARLKVSLKPAATMGYAEAVLTRTLRAMGLPDKVSRKKDSEGNMVLDVEGPSGGILIGRHGQTLESLQYLVSKIVQRTCDDERSLIVIDIEGYRERQKDKLRETATTFAQKAAESGQTVSLQPMNSRDRRIVHLTLRDHAEVTTQSTGEGLRRRVMIVPKNPKVAEVAVSAPAENLSEAIVVEPGNAVPQAHVEVASSETVGNQAPPAPVETEATENAGNRVPTETQAGDDNIGNRA